jgi:hypothetical protein
MGQFISPSTEDVRVMSPVIIMMVVVMMMMEAPGQILRAIGHCRGLRSRDHEPQQKSDEEKRELHEVD